MIRVSKRRLTVQMNRVVFRVFALSWIVACNDGGQVQRWVVEDRPSGPVRPGITVAQLNDVLRDSLSGAGSDSLCVFVTPRNAPHGLAYMVVGDTVVRVDVDSPSVPTTRGIRVGDSTTTALAAYRGTISVVPTPGRDSASRLLIVSTPGAGNYHIVFESEAGVITRYRAGRSPEVEGLQSAIPGRPDALGARCTRPTGHPATTAR